MSPLIETEERTSRVKVIKDSTVTKWEFDFWTMYKTTDIESVDEVHFKIVKNS